MQSAELERVILSELNNLNTENTKPKAPPQEVTDSLNPALEKKVWKRVQKSAIGDSFEAVA